MNALNIRIAEWGDLEPLVDIYNQAVEVGQKTADTQPVTVNSRKEWFDRHDPDKHPIIVAECDGVILGYTAISEYRPGRLVMRHTAEISYYIHFEWHRRGIASKLLEFVIQLCPAIQIKTLFAIMLDTNEESIYLLKKFGFKKWGHMPKVANFDGIEIGHLYYGLRIEE